VKTLRIIGELKLETAQIFFQSLDLETPQSWIVSVVPVPPGTTLLFWKAFKNVKCKPTEHDTLKAFGGFEKITGILSLEMLSQPVLSYAGACGIKEANFNPKEKPALGGVFPFSRMLYRIALEEATYALPDNLDWKPELSILDFQDFSNWVKRGMPHVMPSAIL